MCSRTIELISFMNNADEKRSTVASDKFSKHTSASSLVFVTVFEVYI